VISAGLLFRDAGTLFHIGLAERTAPGAAPVETRHRADKPEQNQRHTALNLPAIGRD
jgi:hypothetical protein